MGGGLACPSPRVRAEMWDRNTLFNCPHFKTAFQAAWWHVAPQTLPSLLGLCLHSAAQKLRRRRWKCPGSLVVVRALLPLPGRHPHMWHCFGAFQGHSTWEKQSSLIHKGPPGGGPDVTSCHQLSPWGCLTAPAAPLRSFCLASRRTPRGCRSLGWDAGLPLPPQEPTLPSCHPTLTLRPDPPLPG